MASLAHYFEHAKAPEMHPTARFWRDALAKGLVQRVVCEFRRKRQAFGFGPAKLILFGYVGTVQSMAPDEKDWDAELDTELIEIGVKARSNPNEAERTGMLLGWRFGQLQTEFGDGYFNAVLFEQLKENGFAAESSVAEKLKDILENKPNHEYDGYRKCVEAIDGVIMSRAAALTHLEYGPGEATEILADAMAYYLDEQYSITSRKTLGFS